MSSDTTAVDAPVVAATVPPAEAAPPAVPAASDGTQAQPGQTAAEPAAPAADPTQQTILDAAPAEPKAPEAPPEPIDPASYEIKLPEGVTREDPLVAAFLDTAAGNRLDGAAVQAVFDKMLPLVTEIRAEPQRAWQTLNAEWQTQVRADPEIGGAKLPATVERVSNVIERFGTPGLKEALRLTGAANHPEILRFVNRLAEAYTEATPVQTGNSGHVSPPPGRALAAMYPSAAQQGAA